MMVLDGDARPAHMLGARFEIMVDGEMEPVAGFIPHPAAAVRRGRAETGEIRDEQGPTRRQHARHLPDRPGEVRNVDEAQIADHEIERAIPERQDFRRTDPIVAVRIARPGRRDQRLGRIDADCREAACAQHPAEASFAAAYVQC